MSIIRNITEKDIPLVASLYRRVNQTKGVTYNEPSLEQVCEGFEDIFLRNPWRDENLSSLVCDDGDGAILGFIGISPRRMTINSRPILVAVSAHLMLEPGRK